LNSASAAAQVGAGSSGQAFGHIAQGQADGTGDGNRRLCRSCSDGSQSGQGTPVESIKKCSKSACLPLNDLEKPAKTVVFGGLYKKKPGLNTFITFLKNTFIIF